MAVPSLWFDRSPNAPVFLLNSAPYGGLSAPVKAFDRWDSTAGVSQSAVIGTPAARAIF